LTVPSIGIVVALPAEARSLVRQRLGFESLHELPEGHWLTVSGAGPDAADRAVNRLIERKVNALISWGCAAAIAEHLVPGHLVLAEHIHGEDDQLHTTDTTWRQRLAANLHPQLKTQSGAIRESRRVVGTRTEKASLHQQTGAVAVDMESGAIARRARAHNLPFLAVRAIADPAMMDFPGAVTRSLNPRGDVRILELLSHIARRPGEIPDLIRLGQAFGAAVRTLQQVRQHAGPDFSFTPPSLQP
jgi:adenosylhomocysteine nucleosidase